MTSPRVRDCDTMWMAGTAETDPVQVQLTPALPRRHGEARFVLHRFPCAAWVSVRRADGREPAENILNRGDMHAEGRGGQSTSRRRRHVFFRLACPSG